MEEIKLVVMEKNEFDHWDVSEIKALSFWGKKRNWWLFEMISPHQLKTCWPRKTDGRNEEGTVEEVSN